MRPLRLNGRVVHQIGLPYHWGNCGIVKGDSANDLISFVADPNVSIQESKALTGNIEPGRRNRERRAVTSGPLIARPFDPDHELRDLPAVRQRPVGKHGIRATRAQEGEET
jgi:formate dehydrogenase major subunit